MTEIHVYEKNDVVKSFYVYVHKYASGEKNGEVFYVGKGQRDRSSSTNGRNRHWHHIVNKYGFKVEIIKRFSNENCAYTFERMTIFKYGLKNLCNMTSGGDGGYKMSPEAVAKMKIYQGGVNNPRYDPTIHMFFHREKGIVACSKYEFRVLHGIKKQNIIRLIKGKYSQASGWMYAGKKTV